MKLATLVYVRHDRHTLMVHRNKKANDMHMGKWNGLGGKLEPGETPEECAIREIREEAGLEILRPRWHGIITFPGFANEEDWYTFMFSVEEFSGTLIDSPEGSLAWIPDGELLDLNLWAGDRIFIPWVLQGRIFSAKFIYRNNEFIGHEVAFYA